MEDIVSNLMGIAMRSLKLQPRSMNLALADGPPPFMGGGPDPNPPTKGERVIAGSLEVSGLDVLGASSIWSSIEGHVKDVPHGHAVTRLEVVVHCDGRRAWWRIGSRSGSAPVDPSVN